MAARLPCSCRRVAWSPVPRTGGPRPADRSGLGLGCALGNCDGPARALAAGIRLFHRTTGSTRRPVTPTAGAEWLSGRPGRRLSLRRIFAGGYRHRVWLTAFVDRNIGAHRQLLRRVARRPATAAAMTPGFWRLRVCLGVSLVIVLRLLNLIARRCRLLQYGFVRCSRALRSCRRRGAAATSTPPAARLEGFAVRRRGAGAIGIVREVGGGCARRFVLYTHRGSTGRIVGRMRHRGVSSSGVMVSGNGTGASDARPCA
jgi:hypothetical protein